MPNYNDGKWHGHNGGECPVHPDTVVEYCMLGGVPGCREKAHILDWGCSGDDWDIIAFRVVKEHKEPREWFAVLNKHGEIIAACSDINMLPDSGVRIVIREVLE